MPFSIYRKISNCSHISNRSSTPNFQKLLFFYKKIATLKTSNWSRIATFEICQEPKLSSYSYKKDNDQVFIKTAGR